MSNFEEDRADRPPPDKEGVVRVSGDPASFEAVYRAYAGAVLSDLQRGFALPRADGTRALFRVGSAFDAEDVCQEAFRVFFRQCAEGTFDTSRPPLPYLLGIARRMAMQRGRRGAREVAVDAAAAGSADPEVEAREAARLAAEFRRSLDAEAEAVFEACFVEEASQREAGERLGLSRDQVYRTLVHIRRAARQFFQKRGWFDEP